MPGRCSRRAEACWPAEPGSLARGEGGDGRLLIAAAAAMIARHVHDGLAPFDPCSRLPVSCRLRRELSAFPGQPPADLVGCLAILGTGRASRHGVPQAASHRCGRFDRGGVAAKQDVIDLAASRCRPGAGRGRRSGTA